MDIVTIIFLFLLSHFQVSLGTTRTNNFNSPFSPRASLIRYWNTHITNNPHKPQPPPQFFVAKTSPLSPIDSAFFTKLAFSDKLTDHLQHFCSLANMFCSFEDQTVDSNNNANFATYNSRRFSNYGSSKRGGKDSFQNYSTGINSVDDSFTKYSKQGVGHGESFTNYGVDGNVANASFGNYGSAAKGGSGDFKSYDNRVNVPGLRFTTYDSGGNGHKLTFMSYSEDTNSGSQGFTSYGKRAAATPSEFTKYSSNANIVDSSFTGYGVLGNQANDSFTSYGNSGNNPQNTFKTYGTGGSFGTDSFSSYRNGANVGKDTFTSYARDANSGKVNFANYGKTFNPGNSSFKEYGKGSKGQTIIGFKGYDLGRSFKDYIQKGVSFTGYSNTSSTINAKSDSVDKSYFVNKRYVEPGRFFRESMLRPGNVMVMPDIVDKMPPRSFLPRSILTKIPFSSSRLDEVAHLFGGAKGSDTEHVIAHALEECEREPSRGEMKRCVGSAEDMIDFATLVLGRNVMVRTTENVNGSKENVLIGNVRGINRGDITKSVSCHQSLYPYLLYYCHSVPKVRVYEADLLDVESKAKINHGVAICHIDTSVWSPDHGAFVALGSEPGKIEVCHWIFENDMTWTTVD